MACVMVTDSAGQEHLKCPLFIFKWMVFCAGFYRQSILRYREIRITLVNVLLVCIIFVC